MLARVASRSGKGVGASALPQHQLAALGLGKFADRRWLMLAVGRSTDLRFGISGIAQHPIVPRPLLTIEDRLQSPIVFPRDMCKGRLIGHVPDRINTRAGSLKSIVDLDKAAIGLAVWMSTA
jgi:hypothetical protein